MQKIPKNLQEVLALIRKLSKALVTRYKVNIQKYILFLYSGNEQFKIKIQNSKTYNNIKIIKHLETNLIRHINLYDKTT